MKYLVVLILTVSAWSARAQDYEGIAEAFGTAYAQEQIKAYLAEYLNKNPEIVYSANPQIGTQAMKYLGKALAAYGLIAARNDKDRAFAAAQLINNNPKVALVILAVQLGDAVISINHKKDLAERYEEIQKIYLAATSDLTKVYSNKYNVQRKYVSDFNDALARLAGLNEKMRANLFYKFSLGEATEDEVTAESIGRAVELVFEIEDEISRAENSFYLVEANVDLESFGFEPGTIDGWREMIQAAQGHRAKIAQVKSVFVKVFRARAAEAITANIDKNLAERRDSLNIYGICVSAINSHVTALNLKQDSPVDHAFLHGCGERFGLRWEY